LVDSVDKLYQDDLLKIGALVELQAEIVSKRNSFHEVAIELLHNLIYLKDQPDLEPLVDSSAPTPATEETRKPFNQLDAKDPLTIKLELMDQLVSAFFVLGKSNQAINKILERLRSELRHVIQKAVATVKKRYENNPVLLQQILSRPPRGVHSHDYPNLFYDMLQIVFTKAKEILIFHRCVTELFDDKLKQQQQMEAAAAEALAQESEASSASSSGYGIASSAGAKQRRAAAAAAALRGEMPAPNSDSSTASYAELTDSTEDGFSAATSPSSASSSSMTTTYRLEHVWEEFQKEIQALIGYYINAPTEASGGAFSASNKGSSKSSTAAPSGDPFTHQGARLFSFSNSSAFTLYEVSETQSFQYRSMDLGDPSPYHLPSIYPLIATFCDLASQIVSAKTPSNRLQNWIDNFISSTLLAVIKMDYKFRIDTAVQSAEAYKSRDTKIVKSAYSADDARRPLLNSAIEVYQCIKELYEDSVAMPIYTTSIHSIMESCLMSYFEQSKVKFEEFVKDSEVGKTVKNSEFQKLVMTDPSWKRILRLYKIGGNITSSTLSVSTDSSEGPSTSPVSSDKIPAENHSREGSGDRNNISASSTAPTSSASKAFASAINSSVHQVASLARPPSTSGDGHGSSGIVDQEETDYMANLMDFEGAWHTGTTNAGFPLQLRHMILDPNRLANLAALHDSCYWIADKVAVLDRSESAILSNGPSTKKSGHMRGDTRDSSSGVGTSKSMGSGGSSIVVAGTSSANGSRRLNRTTSNGQNKLQPGAQFHPKLSSSLTNLTWMFKDLSDQCLHNIYVDFRIQTCYFLDGISRSYVYAAEDRQPDIRVVELNQSLATAFQQLQVFLPPTKLKYLLGGLPTLMSSLLIESLKSHIEAINRNGVVKMIRNVFSLQQNLTGMTTFNEEPFDKVRRYYELLNLNIEEVYQFVAQHHHVDDQGSYTLNQYRTILELIANPRSRSLSDEQEKDLRDKYVLVPFQSDTSAAASRRHVK
jgi:hypothetical protein